MDARTAILALFLAGTLFLFGWTFLSPGFGHDGPTPLISISEATRIVLDEYSGARIKEIELESEEGRLVYEVELITREGETKEVHVNANTGRIEKIEHD